MKSSVGVLHFAVLTLPLAADFMKYVFKLFVHLRQQPCGVRQVCHHVRQVRLLQSYAELVRASLEYVDIDLFIGTSAPGRIAVEGRWPWRTTDVHAGLAARGSEAVCRMMLPAGVGRATAAAYARRHLF